MQAWVSVFLNSAISSASDFFAHELADKSVAKAINVNL